jgi:hypothetical protein
MVVSADTRTKQVHSLATMQEVALVILSYTVHSPHSVLLYNKLLGASIGQYPGSFIIGGGYVEYRSGV